MVHSACVLVDGVGLCACVCVCVFVCGCARRLFAVVSLLLLLLLVFVNVAVVGMVCGCFSMFGRCALTLLTLPYDTELTVLFRHLRGEELHIKSLNVESWLPHPYRHYKCDAQL